MATRDTAVIVGAGMAGAKAAETLREEGYDGRVVLVGEEREAPYERPPLSKDYLRGESERDAARVHPEGFYEEHDIEVLTGERVDALDVGSREVALDGGTRLGYDRLLIATGASPKALPIDGAGLDGIMTLRTIADSDALRERLAAKPRVLVVGAGWIGCEVAASARQLGCDVTIVEVAALPLERVLGPELGAVYRDVHADHGVTYLGETGVERFEGEGRVERVRTTGGTTLDADLVVVGVGVAPRVELARAAGLAVSDGIEVDAGLATSAPGVFAAGDVALARHPLLGRAIRVEHWANALEQGPAAARAMLGREVSYDKVPYFFSDQYDVGMEYSGHSEGADRVVFRGDPATREFIAFWLRDGRVLAGMNVNLWDVADPIQALVRWGGRVDPDRLADPDAALDDTAALSA
jgi:3-phenylpropionate/trans-cinnamate dioxygenase ferredoxin reductase component